MQIDRRDFLSLTAAAGVGLACRSRLYAAEFKTKIQKACIVGSPKTDDEWKKIKDQGYDGVETTSCGVKPEEAAKMREAAEKAGLKIHSVLRGWTQVNVKDPAAVQQAIDSVATALRAAQGYGADAILWVPCKVGGMPMPDPWDFKIEFDEKNGHLKSIADGDNEKYKAYIEAHDVATDSTREAVKKLIPVAEETKVILALENVWNQLWVKPNVFKWLVASFENPWVKAYYDIGNHVKYAPPEEWIRALGPLLAKLHAKDFKLKPDGHGGDFVGLRKGSVNWPSVRKTLDEVGYNGWLTVEGPGNAQDMDLIIKGE
jgi:L-ribulose-5-phosphate 3-epimerase